MLGRPISHNRPVLSRWTRATVAAGLTGAMVLAATPAAEAKSSWKVPAKARVTINGHGYGHGHGMSQYGAEGAARAGLKVRKIVKFYYPRTSWGRAGGKVKVLISADGGGDVVVLPRKRLEVRSLGSGKSWPLPTGKAKRWRLTAAGTDTAVAYRHDGWHRWKTVAGEAEFRAAGKPITLVTPSVQARYRGALRSVGGTSRSTVNVLPLEDYLRGVVPMEIPASWSPAAVQAQAVAARTYATYERDHPRASGYQICDTTSCQVYGGADVEQPGSNAAIRATAKRVLTYREKPAFTQFSASSGGWTAAGSMPYLRAKKDPYDGWSGNPVHSWSVTLTDRDLERAYPAIGNLKRLRVSGRDGHGQWGGRVGRVTLVGSKSTVRVSGDSFRFALGLRSTWFTFRVKAR